MARYLYEPMLLKKNKKKMRLKKHKTRFVRDSNHRPPKTNDKRVTNQGYLDNHPGNRQSLKQTDDNIPDFLPLNN